MIRGRWYTFRAVVLKYYSRSSFKLSMQHCYTVLSTAIPFPELRYTDFCLYCSNYFCLACRYSFHIRWWSTIQECAALLKDRFCSRILSMSIGMLFYQHNIPMDIDRIRLQNLSFKSADFAVVSYQCPLVCYFINIKPSMPRFSVQNTHICKLQGTKASYLCLLFSCVVPHIYTCVHIRGHMRITPQNTLTRTL